MTYRDVDWGDAADEFRPRPKLNTARDHTKPVVPVFDSPDTSVPATGRDTSGRVPLTPHAREQLAVARAKLPASRRQIRTEEPIPVPPPMRRD